MATLGLVKKLRERLARWLGRQRIFASHGRVGQKKRLMQAADRAQALLMDDGRYRLLVEAVTDYAIYMLDPAGVVMSWNRGAQRFKGYETSEIIGQSFACFFTEEDRRDGVPQRELHTAAQVGNLKTEGWRVRKDGQRFWAHVVIEAIRGPEGELIGFAKITRDLTEGKRSQDALKQAEQQFRLLVQSVKDYAIYMIDLEGRITNWNPGAQRIKGYLSDEVVGSHFSRFYTEEDREFGEPQKALDTALREGRFERESLRVRKNGARFWAHVVIEPIRGDDGAAIGFAKITRDITASKENRRALEQAREALFHAQKMEAVGQLTGGLAHDFNNLLAGISGGLDLLQARLAQGRVRDLDRYIVVAQTAAKRAAALTHRLLAFSRRQTLAPQATDVNRLVNGMEDLIRRTVGPMIEVEVVAAAGLWPSLIDPNQLENALLNLCINARDAMPDGGRLTIETCNRWMDERTARARDMMRGQYVSLCVSDTGTGMTPEVISRAFDPFFTTKPIGEGTGLGLSMIHGFARQSGGQARIYSELGQGSMVCLYLPRHHTAAIDDDAVAETAKTLRAEPGEAVLVVDDEPAVRMLVTEVLEDLGYAAIEAEDGPSGLKVLQSKARIDLLITDFGLPRGMNGRQLADAGRVYRPELKVLFMTGYAENAVVGNGHLQAGMEVLTKPFAMDALASRIKDIIKGG